MPTDDRREDPAIWAQARKVKPDIESYERAKRLVDLVWQAGREVDGSVSTFDRAYQLMGWAETLRSGWNACSSRDFPTARKAARLIIQESSSEKQKASAYNVLANVEMHSIRASANDTELTNHVEEMYHFSSSAVRIDPKNTFALTTHALACQKMDAIHPGKGYPVKAKESLRSAIAIDPKTKDIANELMPDTF